MPLIFWDRALERMAEGEGLASICTGEDGLPSLRMWWQRCEDEPDFLQRAYRAAIAGELIPDPDDRPAPGARRRPHSYTVAEYEAALVEIAAGRRPYSLRQSGTGDVSHTSLDRYRKRNADFDRRMRAALDARGHRLAPAAGRKPKPKAGQAGPTHELRRRLLQNEFFAAIDRVVPRGLPDFIRDDVRSEMLADMLAGELDLADVKEAAGYYLTDYYRLHDGWREMSLDAPVGDEGGRTYVDLIPSDAAHF